MATRALLIVISASSNRSHISSGNMIKAPVSVFSAPSLNFQTHGTKIYKIARSFSSDTTAAVEVSCLAETARISLTSAEINECGAKIRQVIDWFGQLQEIDVNSVEPALRAEMESGNLREDTPETFKNRDSIRDSIPSFEETYIKVPRVLNKE